jgi:hypothetical protein
MPAHSIEEIMRHSQEDRTSGKFRTTMYSSVRVPTHLSVDYKSLWSYGCKYRVLYMGVSYRDYVFVYTQNLKQTANRKFHN